MDPGSLDVFALAQSLVVPGTELTADQLAQLRALNIRHYTAVYALLESSRREGRLPTREERAALDATTAAAVRRLVDG
jgi:hypothetical protein